MTRLLNLVQVSGVFRAYIIFDHATAIVYLMSGLVTAQHQSQTWVTFLTTAIELLSRQFDDCASSPLQKLKAAYEC
eukprot:m.40242 g.40242  ORF g.40242 m.40242 type:complete len:76 (-) comp10410_c0_seq2:325-552(-)